MGFGSNDDAARAARQSQQEQQARVTKATGDIEKTFSGFNDQFFKQRAQDYVNFATPQLTQQFGDTKKSLDFNLANRGIDKSSVGTGLMSSLLKNFALQKQGLVDTGVQQSNALQQQVAQNKSNLIGQAQAAEDPSSIARGALSTAASFAAPSTFAPIGNLLGNWANIYLANKTQQAYSPLTNYYLRGGGAPLPTSSTTTGGY